MKNKTGLVALVVLAAATLLMVFFVLPNINRQKPAETPVATGTETAAEGGETKTADGKQGRGTPAEEGAATAEPEAAADAAAPVADTAGGAEAQIAVTGKPADEQAAAEETAGADAAPADPAAGWVTPAFDLLRVEPDGSTVIAGRAEPNTKVEIRDGETVIATAEAGPSGDFAAVFDEPLKAGDYQLTLNASDGKGASKASEEVATVSVPKDAGGEVLAMVSEPGAASRLITVPEDAAASAAAGEEKPAEQAAAEQSAAETAAASPEAEAPAADAATAVATTQEPAAAAEEGVATTENGAAAPAADDAAPVAEDAATAEAPAQAGKAQVRVAAVELEGERMFVAGSAPPEARVRVYADDRLVGEAKADAQGRFVVDGLIDMAVGRHTIRADVLGADGGKVELRASVPFDRPEGEQVAVVAQDDQASATAAPALGPVGGGTFDRLRDEAGKALALLKGLFADGRTPGAEELAAARSATEIALKSLAEFKPGAEEGDVARAMAAKASAAAADALAKLRALPADAGGVGTALGAIETAVAAALAPAIETAEGAGAAGTQAAPAEAAPEQPAPAETAGTEAPAAPDAAAPAADAAAPAAPATPDTAAAEAPAPDSAAAAPEASAPEGAAAPAEGQQAAVAEEPETVEQAPLKPSKTSVIIRRGDTLWQISRRIYGKGVRYTTIYLANQDQIEDPDRILPGQVFGVPDHATESDADAEALHRRHMRGE